jgi:hypothetical protein
MESLFAVIASASLVFSWVTGTKLASVHVTPVHDACTGRVEFQAIASQNAVSLASASVAPFGRMEAGWQIYAPQIAQTIGTPCAPDSKGFAATLAGWQKVHRLPATGAINTVTLAAMKNTWQRSRPFVAAFERGSCPAAVSEASLAEISSREGWSGKISKVDPHALAALRRMVAAARAEDPRLAHDRQLFAIVSAYRSPAYDAGRCAAQKNCNGVVRARCSPHRTGKALDLNLGSLPGSSPVSSNDANRLYQTRTPAYRWLVKNAGRFGFVNYVFEPWHWEWVGDTQRETQIIEATLRYETPKRPRAAQASLASAPPLTQLWVQLRALFGNAG